MKIRTLYIITGYVSLITGIFAAISISRPQWLKFGIPLAICGFIFSIANIFLNVKYFSDQEKWPKGYMGMFLSSLPVLFLMFVLYKYRR